MTYYLLGIIGVMRRILGTWSECNYWFSSKIHQQPEEVGHAYGPARNSVSHMVSEHCKINVETALEVRFCTCPVVRTRSCRSTILGSRIVEMRPSGSGPCERGLVLMRGRGLVLVRGWGLALLREWGLVLVRGRGLVLVRGRGPVFMRGRGLVLLRKWGLVLVRGWGPVLVRGRSLGTRLNRGTLVPRYNKY